MGHISYQAQSYGQGSHSGTVLAFRVALVVVVDLRGEFGLGVAAGLAGLGGLGGLGGLAGYIGRWV